MGNAITTILLNIQNKDVKMKRVPFHCYFNEPGAHFWSLR